MRPRFLISWVVVILSIFGRTYTILLCRQEVCFVGGREPNKHCVRLAHSRKNRKMTEFFSQKQIDEIRECFNFYSSGGLLNSASQLRCALRSLGYSPTAQKTAEHFKSQNRKPIEFATFLDICKDEQNSPDPLTEIIKALSGLDRSKTRSMPSRELASILAQVGEKMTKQEIDYLLSKVEVNGMVPHQKLIEYISR